MPPAGFLDVAATGDRHYSASTTGTRLHGPIHNKYAADPDKVHAWKQASRIERDPEPPEDPAPPTT